MHRESMGTHRNAKECIVAHRSAYKRSIFFDKGYHGLPINARTSTYLLYAVVVAAVIFFVLVLCRLFE